MCSGLGHVTHDSEKQHNSSTSNGFLTSCWRFVITLAFIEVNIKKNFKNVNLKGFFLINVRYTSNKCGKNFAEMSITLVIKIIFNYRQPSVSLNQTACL